MNVAPSLFVVSSLAAFLIGRAATPDLPSHLAVPPPVRRPPVVADVQLDIARARHRFLAAHVRSPEPEPEASAPPPRPVPLPPADPPRPRPRPPTPAEIAIGLGRDVSAVVSGPSGPELLLVDQRSNVRRALRSGETYGSGWRFAGIESGYIVLRKGRASQRIPIGLSGSNATLVNLPAAPSVGAQSAPTLGAGEGQIDAGRGRPRRRRLRRGHGAKGVGGS